MKKDGKGMQEDDNEIGQLKLKRMRMSGNENSRGKLMESRLLIVSIDGGTLREMVMRGES